MDAPARRDLEILTAIAEGRPLSQRALARQLGIALGLANLYLKRLARKGYLKVTTLPPERVHYLLTPQGMAEKVRLTYEFMEYSLRLYREARQTLRSSLAELPRESISRIALVGTGEAAELAWITLREIGLEPTGVFAHRAGSTFPGIEVRPLGELAGETFDLVVVATFADPAPELAELVRRGCPPERVLTLRGRRAGATPPGESIAEAAARGAAGEAPHGSLRTRSSREG